GLQMRYAISDRRPAQVSYSGICDGWFEGGETTSRETGRGTRAFYSMCHDETPPNRHGGWRRLGKHVRASVDRNGPLSARGQGCRMAHKRSPSRMKGRASFFVVLFASLAASAWCQASAAPDWLSTVSRNVFEVVLHKPDIDPFVYQERLPLELHRHRICDRKWPFRL